MCYTKPSYTILIGNKSFNQTIQPHHHGITPPSLHHHSDTTTNQPGGIQNEAGRGAAGAGGFKQEY